MLCLLAATWGAPSSAQDALLSDAGAPDAGVLSPYASEYQLEVRQIRAFLAGELALDVDPASLFELPLDLSDEALRIERQRITQLLERASDSAERRTPQPEGKASKGKSQAAPAERPAPAKPEQGAEGELPVDGRAWRARLALDRARLEFYGLPAARRAELVRLHRERQEQASALHQEVAISQAEREARRAEEQQRAALEAARRASTEAARLVNEEYARLLAVTQKQAEHARALLQRRSRVDARAEAVLVWRRRVAELLVEPLDPVTRSRVDLSYVDLHDTLRDAREQLSVALGRIGDGVESVPMAGPDPLAELPREVEREVAVEQRRRVNAKAAELGASERELELSEARQLMNEVETLNRLRLELLPALTPEKRSSVLGFGPPGWEQAASEARQVVLTLRYHLRLAYEWLGAIQSGSQRGSSVWLAFVLLLQWALPIGAFVWWRRHADGQLERLRQEQRDRMRRSSGRDWHRFDYAERAIVFLQRVRRPLEWLLLVGLITWLMPEQIHNLLEVRLASTVLLWVFGGHFLVLAIDALSSQRTRGLPLRGSVPMDTNTLRLRSLRLVGHATIAFGLLLSLSELLVGRGTIYGWVFSTCWFAAVPIFFVTIAWWRPFIFERFARMRRPNGFEQWVLQNREPPRQLLASTLSSLAAITGGVYLFVLGAVRIVRGRVLTFELTRRLLAYLFRRDLSKKARAEAVPHQQLSGETFRALGPEIRSAHVVPSEADPELDAVSRDIRQAGGGAIAIVGERGAGKTTLIERLVASLDGLIAVSCTTAGASELKARLNHALGLPAQATLDVAAQSLDSGGEDRALLIDDAQFLLRPTMGGLLELDEVLTLFRRHSRSCTWILAFDESVWRFVERSRGAQPLFDRVIRLNPWAEEAIVRLITQRNETAGIKPDFSGLAIGLPENADEIDLLEALRRTEANYYRLLWDYASGNPGVALHFWRRSLGEAGAGRVLVRLFDAPDMAQLEALPDSAAFVLRAILQLGWADVEGIRQVTSLPREQVEDVLRYGNQLGYFDVDGVCYRVNWDWFRAVTRFLDRRHLSFSSA